MNCTIKQVLFKGIKLTFWEHAVLGSLKLIFIWGVHLVHALPGTENNHPGRACMETRDMPTYMYLSAFY